MVPNRGVADAVDVVAVHQRKLLPGMKERHRRRKLRGTLQIDDDYVSGQLWSNQSVVNVDGAQPVPFYVGHAFQAWNALEVKLELSAKEISGPT